MATIQTQNGPLVVRHYSSGYSGLIVHRDGGRTDGAWRLTHGPTGYAVTGRWFATRDEARRAAGLVSALCDWATIDVADLDGMRELGRRVVAVLDGRPDPAPSWWADPEGISDCDSPGEARGHGSIVESLLPADWELSGDDLDGLLVCPCGHTIEMDGRCPSGHVSPLRMAGLI